MDVYTNERRDTLDIVIHLSLREAQALEGLIQQGMARGTENNPLTPLSEHGNPYKIGEELNEKLPAYMKGA